MGRVLGTQYGRCHRRHFDQIHITRESSSQNVEEKDCQEENEASEIQGALP